METGEVGTALSGIFRGYYTPLEDITRLFILASRNDVMLTHPFSKVLKSTEGLDGTIGDPINKPYCSMISSALYGDFEFQREFDNNIKTYNSIYNKTLPYYDQICMWLNREQMPSIKRGKGISDIDGWKEIIETIKSYYKVKLAKYANENYISNERGNYLSNKFDKLCNIVEKQLENRIPRNIRKIMFY